MSKFDPVLPRLEIECWILGVEMSLFGFSLIGDGGLCSVITGFSGFKIECRGCDIFKIKVQESE